jgi:hypothetical protein
LIQTGSGELQEEWNMSNPSYYFTLFKKFQCLGHIPEGFAHGGNVPPQGISFKDPVALYNAARAGIPLIGTNTGDTPLWGVLNAKAHGAGSISYMGLNWLAMPQGAGAAAAWSDSAVGGQPLVDAFAAWLAAGKPQDFPAFIVLPNAGTVPGAIDTGPSVFVCSSANDDGTRPGTVPNDFWNSSLIYLVDRSNGSVANPSTLHGAMEFYVAGVIGNRGDAAGGKYSTGPATATTPGVQATAWALTFGTGGASPAVELPSLSNLDVTSQSGLNDVYFLPSAKYDIVGFRFAVQTVFDGLVNAINQAVSDGVFTLPTGVGAVQWLETLPSHVCVKVAVRRDDESWPPYDASPQMERRIAQKNLVVFDTDLASPSPSPNIKWKYFTMGGPLAALMRIVRANDREAGMNTLLLSSDFAQHASRILIAVPRTIFARWVGKGGVKGFEILERDTHERFRVPFADHVILAQAGEEAGIRLPCLDDNILPMAVGVEIDEGKLKPDTIQRVSVTHRALVPRFGTGSQSRCYELVEAIVGGFTLEFRIHRSEAPKR